MRKAEVRLFRGRKIKRTRGKGVNLLELGWME